MPRHSSKNVTFYSTALFLNLAVLGLVIAFAAGWWIEKADPYLAVSAFSYSQPTKPLQNSIPRRLSIPQLNMELDIKLGTYNTDGTWALDNSNAFYATPSVPVNKTKGTTLIYGHNTEQVFKRLNQISPGTELVITTEDNKIFTYEYSFVAEVNPHDTGVFNSTNAPNVTLQTCSGPWDEYRSLYTFTFKGIKSNG